MKPNYGLASLVSPCCIKYQYVKAQKSQKISNQYGSLQTLDFTDKLQVQKNMIGIKWKETVEMDSVILSLIWWLRLPIVI